MVACIRFEDQLDGISNYLQWKVQMSVVLKENKIWNYVSPVDHLFRLGGQLHVP
jgi:hypothetical protein